MVSQHGCYARLSWCSGSRVAWRSEGLEVGLLPEPLGDLSYSDKMGVKKYHNTLS